MFIERYRYNTHMYISTYMNFFTIKKYFKNVMLLYSKRTFKNKGGVSCSLLAITVELMVLLALPLALRSTQVCAKQQMCFKNTNKKS